MIERHFNATFINSVVNDPAVRPDMDEAAKGVIDLTAVLQNPGNIALMGEYGGCVFIKMLPGMYEVHTQVLPKGRGKWIADFAPACCDWMFTRTDAFEIITRIPIEHLGAAKLAQHAGLKIETTRHMECVWRGKRQDVDIYSFRVQDWAVLPNEKMITAGMQFHDFLHEEAERLGVTDPAHEDDTDHNRVVGIALAMLEGGQIAKAINFYNRWAYVVRHPLIFLIKQDPLTIRFDIGNLIFENGTKRVELMEPGA